jgi:hypothetical protein
MMARARRYGKSSVKTRVGIATALLAGGAVAAGAVLASSHGAATTATSAAYSSSYNGNVGNTLSSAMGNWNWSRQNSYNQLAQLTQVRQYGQNWHHHQMVAAQRGIVVLATPRFIIVQSANGSLHLWLLTGRTQFQNVSTTTTGMRALTASTSAAQQAMWSGNMLPATTLLAGSPTTAATMLTPAPAAQTVSVQVANTNLTVTVTVTRTMATVSQTATTPLNGMPTWSPITFTQNAWLAPNQVARGDLVLVVGTRSHWTLKAQLVLFAPLTTADIGGRASTPTTTTPVVQPTAVATHW